jgi:hypothetical protein
MLKQIVSTLSVLTLCGCGIGEVFDQHPTTARAESDDSSNAAASSESEIAPMSASMPGAAGAASPMAPQSPPPEDASASASVATTTAQSVGNEDCRAVATARADDAAANGYDDDLQQVVHDKTYADCMAWNAAHP